MERGSEGSPVSSFSDGINDSIFLIFLFIWLCWVLVVAQRIFNLHHSMWILLVRAHRIFSCGMPDLLAVACQIFFIVAACEFLVVRCKLFIVAWGIQFPNQESNPDPLYWEHGILATGPPRKFCDSILKELFYQNGVFLELAFFFFAYEYFLNKI